jgi:hypothetical protein
MLGSQGARLPDVTADRLGVGGVELLMLAGDGVKIAVLTLAPAERNMNVDSERNLIFVRSNNSHRYLL